MALFIGRKSFYNALWISNQLFVSTTSGLPGIPLVALYFCTTVMKSNPVFNTIYGQHFPAIAIHHSCVCIQLLALYIVAFVVGGGVCHFLQSIKTRDSQETMHVCILVLMFAVVSHRYQPGKTNNRSFVCVCVGSRIGTAFSCADVRIHSKQKRHHRCGDGCSYVVVDLHLEN